MMWGDHVLGDKDLEEDGHGLFLDAILHSPRETLENIWV
jgi:hypothetical protein